MKKLKYWYLAYAIYDLPSDIWLAIRTKTLREFIANKFNVTDAMMQRCGKIGCKMRGYEHAGKCP